MVTILLAGCRADPPPTEDGGEAEAPLTAASPEPPAKSSHAAGADLRSGLVGIWQDDYQGKRTMTLNADGTASMVVELSGVKAALFASRLSFDMEWSVEGRTLKKRTTGGEPEAAVKAILATMGDRVEERVLELTPERLLLLDPDGKTKYDWRSVKP